MWKNARRAVGKKVVMGKDAGIEFPDSIFGCDDELEKTECHGWHSGNGIPL